MPRYCFWPTSWPASLVSLLLAGLSLAVASVLALKGPPALSAASNNNNQRGNAETDNDTSKRRIRIACLGNSIQYYNDCPRLLERMFRAAGYEDMQQNSCLRGGASVVSLWNKGNGMGDKFATPHALQPDGSYDIGAPTVQALLEDATFDFVIINDHTQSPARQETRDKTTKALVADYAPLLLKSNMTPILLQTAAYRVPDIRGTSDLGTFEAFTKLLEEGIHSYKQHLDAIMKEHTAEIQARIAPVGRAYADLNESNRSLWEQLYHTDDFHPSPHGTLLQAYILFMTITGSTPPMTYDPATWWDRARRMQPPNEAPLARPTIAEATVLRDVAVKACGLTDS